MGWETTLMTHLRFNRKTYNHYYEVENDLEEVRDIIKRQWEDMRSLAYMTEPKKFCEEEETPVVFIERSLRDIQEMLEECIVEEYKLSLLLENWDKCHDKETGRAIPDPEGIDWDSSFLDGDFVETTEDNSEEEMEDNDVERSVSTDELIHLNCLSNTSDAAIFSETEEWLIEHGVPSDLIQEYKDRNQTFPF